MIILFLKEFLLFSPKYVEVSAALILIASSSLTCSKPCVLFLLPLYQILVQIPAIMAMPLTCWSIVRDLLWEGKSSPSESLAESRQPKGHLSHKVITFLFSVEAHFVPFPGYSQSLGIWFRHKWANELSKGKELNFKSKISF